MKANFRDGRFILTVKNEHVMDKIQFFVQFSSYPTFYKNSRGVLLGCKSSKRKVDHFILPGAKVKNGQ